MKTVSMERRRKMRLNYLPQPGMSAGAGVGAGLGALGKSMSDLGQPLFGRERACT